MYVAIYVCKGVHKAIYVPCILYVIITVVQIKKA